MVGNIRRFSSTLENRKYTDQEFDINYLISQVKEMDKRLALLEMESESRRIEKFTPTEKEESFEYEEPKEAIEETVLSLSEQEIREWNEKLPDNVWLQEDGTLVSRASRNCIGEIQFLQERPILVVDTMKAKKERCLTYLTKAIPKHEYGICFL